MQQEKGEVEKELVYVCFCSCRLTFQNNTKISSQYLPYNTELDFAFVPTLRIVTLDKSVLKRPQFSHL